MTNKTKAKIRRTGRLMTYGILVAVMILAVGVVLFFTNGGKTEFKTFYVRTEDGIRTTDGTHWLRKGWNRFEVGYVFEEFQADFRNEYTVKIVVDPESEDFEFSLDGQPASWHAEEDLTSLFNLKQDQDHFELEVKGTETAETLLRLRYPDRELKDVAELDLGESLLLMIVEAYDGSQIRLKLRMQFEVTEIVLNPGEVVF